MLAFVGATVITGTGERLAKATVLLENGKFVGVGCNLEIPSEATVIDASGKVITPGLIDVHTHLGLIESGIGKEGNDVNETTGAATPSIRAIDGINPLEGGFSDARRSGVTTVQIMPGSANVIGGEMVIVKTAGTIVDEMVVAHPSGMKAALGENPKTVHGGKGKLPATRMGVAALFREQLIAAQNYLSKIDSERDVDRDLKFENLAKVLTREIPLRIHAHRADDIATVVRLAKEFQFNYTIEHCTEGHLIAPFLANEEVRVSVGPTMSPKTKVETAGKGFHTLVALAEAGVPFSITTDHPVVGIEHLMTSAILAVKYGLPEDKALEAITLNAAKHLDIDDRVGSIESGKDADLVVWSGDPFDLRSKVEVTIINGEIVYEA